MRLPLCAAPPTRRRWRRRCVSRRCGSGRASTSSTSATAKRPPRRRTDRNIPDTLPPLFPSACLPRDVAGPGAPFRQCGPRQFLIRPAAAHGEGGEPPQEGRGCRRCESSTRAAGGFCRIYAWPDMMPGQSTMSATYVPCSRVDRSGGFAGVKGGCHDWPACLAHNACLESALAAYRTS
jgi:hypothetical protein